MNKEDIARINELGRLAKKQPLTDTEKSEQALLRAVYLREFRAALRGEVVDSNDHSESGH